MLVADFEGQYLCKQWEEKGSEGKAMKDSNFSYWFPDYLHRYI